MQSRLTRPLGLAALACALACFGISASAQAVTDVTTTYLGGENASGIVASGTIYWQMVNGCSGPLGAAVSGTSAGGQINGYPFGFNVVNGASSGDVPTPASASPSIAYAVTVIDSAGRTIIGNGMDGTGHVATGGPYGCVQPSGSTYNFDAYIPNAAVTFLPSSLFSGAVATNLTAGSPATASVTPTGGGSYQLNFGIPAGAAGPNCASDSPAGTCDIDGSLLASQTVQGTEQGVWQRLGVVNYGTSSGNNIDGVFDVEEPTVIPRSDPQILPSAMYTEVDGMWYSNNTEVCYAESPDGVQWTLGSTSDCVTGHDRSFIIKIGSTWYMYAINTSATAMDVYTSTNGYTGWTLWHSSVIATGTPSWLVDPENSSAVVIGGTMYLFLESDESYPHNLTIWTSTDYHTFTYLNEASTGTLPPDWGPSRPYLINGTWYLWVHSAAPSEIYRLSAPAITGPWALAVTTPELSVQTLDEGLGNGTFGQVADADISPCLGNANKTCLYYTASQYGSVNGATARWYQEIKLAVADMPMSSLVLTQGGDNLGHLDNPGLLGQSYDYPTRSINYNNHGIENFINMTGWGNLTLLNDGASSPQTTYLNVGCSTTSSIPCTNGNVVANFYTAIGENPYNASMTVDPNGGNGITWTLPRNLSGLGYHFQPNGGGSDLLYLDSSTGKATTLHNTLDDGSSGGGMWLGSNDHFYDDGNFHINATPNSHELFFDGNGEGYIAMFDASVGGSPVVQITTTGEIIETALKDTGISAASGEYCVQIDTAGNLTNTGSACGSGGGGGSGTVTSVALTVPTWLTVGGSPITTSGTLAVTAAGSQTSHNVIGTCGSATSFAPCALVAADIPTLNQSTTGSSASFTGSLSGDVTGTQSATVVGKVNGAAVPTSAEIASTNSSEQLVAATAHNQSVISGCTTTNSGNTYTCSTSPSFTPAAGDQINVEFNAANTGSATLNVNSGGAKTIYKWGNTTTLASGDIQASHYIRATYDGSHWQLEGQLGNAVATNLTGTPALPNGVSATTQATTDYSTDLATDALVTVRRVANIDLTAQAANVSTATAYAVPSGGAGQYLVTCYVVLTTAASSSSTLPNCLVNWYDQDTDVLDQQSPTYTGNTGNTVGLSGVGPGYLGSVAISAKASTNIQYLTENYVSSGGTSMKYALHLRVVYLGD